MQERCIQMILDRVTCWKQNTCSINYKEELRRVLQTTTEEISVAPAPVAVANSENIQTGMPKNMVLDPGWFDGN